MKKSNTTITPPYKNKALGLTATVLALGSMLGSASIANAATFNFSFDNQDGAVNGTVSGTITLPDGDGTFPASSIIVTSAPATLGYTLPLDVLNGVVAVTSNTFNVVGGIINAATSIFASQVTGNAIFGLNAGFGNSYLTDINNQFTFVENTGVLDNGNSTLLYSSNPPASTPEPTSVITLIGVGVLGVASKLKKKG
jgi:hypothetical protein